MNSPKISLIAAIGKDRELGRGNKLLFDIPEDMKLFREKTSGHAIIMGRKTYESIGKLLPNRANIVVSRDLDKFLNIHPGFISGSIQENFKGNGSRIKSGMTAGMAVSSIEEAIELGRQIEGKNSTTKGEVFVIGGAQIYALAMPFADKLYLTIVNKTVKDADAFFPDYSEFGNVLFERHSRDKNYSYTFVDLTRD